MVLASTGGKPLDGQRQRPRPAEPARAADGGANGRLKGNRAIKVDKREPTANLLLALGELAGAEVDSIGKSTGKLSL